MEELLKPVFGITIMVVGLSIAGWGVAHFNEAPLPTRNLGIGAVQYHTSAQLKAISAGLVVLTFGAFVVWSAFPPGARRKRRRTRKKGR